MRRILIPACCLLALSACADEAITPAHVDARGELVTSPRNNFSDIRVSGAAAGVHAEPLAIEADLVVPQAHADTAAPDAKNAVSAPSVGSDQVLVADGERIELQVRAPDLSGARDVTFVWSHNDVRIQRNGWLTPGPEVVVVDTHVIDLEHDVGPWNVEIYGRGDSAPILFERSFELRRPTPG